MIRNPVRTFPLSLCFCMYLVVYVFLSPSPIYRHPSSPSLPSPAYIPPLLLATISPLYRHLSTPPLPSQPPPQPPRFSRYVSQPVVNQSVLIFSLRAEMLREEFVCGETILLVLWAKDEDVHLGQWTQWKGDEKIHRFYLGCLLHDRVADINSSSAESIHHTT